MVRQEDIDESKGGKMIKGYGKIMRLDLTNGHIRYEYVDESVARKYLGLA